jgi:IclR family acetate operon transcriptional repressor
MSSVDGEADGAEAKARREGRRPVRVAGGGRTPAKAASGQVQSLLRALALIDRLAEAEHGASVTELARDVGLPASTAHRLLTTLEQERYVAFDLERRLWSVGVQSFVVGSAFLRNRGVVPLARPRMRRLMEETGETVNLAVEDEGEAVYLTQVECRQMMRAFARPGGRVPLHCSGVGKALLAALDPEEGAAAAGRRGLARMTPRTIVEPDRLRADLARVRERGYAVDDEEHAVGLRCVAAVAFDEFAHPAAAISVSGPLVRIGDERLAELGLAVRQAADALTRAYGGKLPAWRAP